MRHAASEPVGHDRRASGLFEKANRPTEMALFTNLYLLIHGESTKIVLVKVVELCEISNFAFESIISFSMVCRLQSPKVVHLKLKSAF